jgi:hypothetical protein
MHKELTSTITCSLNIYRLNHLIENYIAHIGKLPCTNSITAEQRMHAICKVGGEGLRCAKSPAYCWLATSIFKCTLM